MSEKSSTEKVTVRRTPKFLTFFVFGAALGAIISVISSAITLTMTPSTDSVPLYQIVAFFALFAAAIGGLLGLTAAVIFDRRLRRSTRMAEAQRTVTTGNAIRK